MGYITPVCLATNGIALYGYTITTKQGETGKEYNILIKSNDNPTSVNSLTWSLVSAVDTTGNNILSVSTTTATNRFACAVDDQGVFTVMGTSYKESKADVRVDNPRGLQYRGGRWDDVKVSVSYGWDNFQTNMMFYRKNAGGLQTLYHAFTFSGSGKAHLSSMEQSSFFITMGYGWPFKGSPSAGVSYLNDRLYSLSWDSKDNWLESMPLSSSAVDPPITPPMTPVGLQSLNITQVGTSCDSMPLVGVKMRILGKTMYLYCTNPSPRPNAIFSSDGTTLGPPIPVKDMPSDPWSSLVVGPETGPFLFLHDPAQIHGIPLTGPNAGVKETSASGFKIADPYGQETLSLPLPLPPGATPSNGVGPGGSGGSGGTGGKGSSGEGLSVGAIVGIVVGVLVVSVTVLVIIRRRKRQAAEKVDDVQGQGLEDVDVKGYSPAQDPRQGHQKYAYHEPTIATTAGGSAQPVVQGTHHKIEEQGHQEHLYPVFSQAGGQYQPQTTLLPTTAGMNSLRDWEPQPFVPPNSVSHAPPSIPLHSRPTGSSPQERPEL